MLRQLKKEQTLRQFQTAGVQAPTARPITIITQNKIGETPIFIMLGKNTGVNNNIAGLTSIKVPAKRMIKINNKSIPAFPSPKPVIISERPSGTLS